MLIIDEECKVCNCNEKCGTDVQKGSIVCLSNRISAKQSKADMIRKMKEEQKIEKSEWSGANGTHI